MQCKLLLFWHIFIVPFFQLVEVVEDPLVPTLGGDRNNQNRTAEKNCGA